MLKKSLWILVLLLIYKCNEYRCWDTEAATFDGVAPFDVFVDPWCLQIRDVKQNFLPHNIKMQNNKTNVIVYILAFSWIWPLSPAVQLVILT